MPNQYWSSAGSAGTVDVADIAKVVFAKSFVQLQGFDLIVSTPQSAVGLPLVQTRAVIRYGVTPVEATVEGPVALLLRYRDGSGHVAANLIEVDIPTGNETTLLVPPGSTEFSFDSQKFSRSNAAQVHQSDASAQLDFENHAYYVELTLAATSHVGIPIFFPPKVSVIQLIRQFE